MSFRYYVGYIENKDFERLQSIGKSCYEKIFPFGILDLVKSKIVKEVCKLPNNESVNPIIFANRYKFPNIDIIEDVFISDVDRFFYRLAKVFWKFHIRNHNYDVEKELDEDYSFEEVFDNDNGFISNSESYNYMTYNLIHFDSNFNYENNKVVVWRL